MIRIAVIDDHPALRAGLRTVLEAEPGLVFVGDSSGDDESVWPLLKRTDPDLVLLDYHLPHGDGLQLCHRIKRSLTAPKVLVYSAYASPALALPATLAGADGLIDKGLGARDLFEAIRLSHRGELDVPKPPPYVLREALERVEIDDRPIIGMLLDGSTEAEVAQALRLDAGDIDQAVRRILARLRVDVPQATS
jgi:DNA-binding NarL/FixJ family response regulator